LETFNAKCVDWTNNRRPLRYFYYYDVGESSQQNKLTVAKDLPLLNPNSNEMPAIFDFQLPIGKKSLDYVITLIALISNEFGQYAITHLNVTVRTCY